MLSPTPLLSKLISAVRTTKENCFLSRKDFNQIRFIQHQGLEGCGVDVEEDVFLFLFERGFLEHLQNPGIDTLKFRVTRLGFQHYEQQGGAVS